MDPRDPPASGAYLDSGSDCVFARALLVCAAGCELAKRRSLGERDIAGWQPLRRRGAAQP